MDFLSKLILEQNIRKSKLIIVGISIFISLLAIAGWLFGKEFFMGLIPEGPKMKFNTALLFFLTSINVAIYTIRRKQHQKVFKILNSFTILLSLFTLLEYLAETSFGIDDFLISDALSQRIPGRMSPATALCFVFLGISLANMNSKKKDVVMASQLLLVFISLTSLVSTVSFLLNIPSESKAFFMQTMSINTSLLFLGISLVLQLDIPNSELAGMIKGKLNGSKMFIKFLPFIVFVPIILGLFFLHSINHGVFSVPFGISLFTVLLILSGLMYIYILAKGLNDTDVKRSKLETALKESNRELAQFKNGLDQVAIVAITDKRGVITYVNKKFCDISKYSEEELLGQTHSIINSDYHPKQFFRNLWKTIASGEIWVGNIKNRAKDGSYYWVNTAIVPFKDSDGNVIEYMAIRQDVTQEKLAEELLHSDYVKKLEYKNKELEQFVYIASHDLQEPLRTLKSFSSLLIENQSDQLDEDGILSLNFISDSASRMSALIKDLLDYSRIGRDRNLNTINCNELIKTVTGDLKNTIDRNNTTLGIGELPTIKGYPTELRLLFQNLITNAIKFQDANNKPYITIKASRLTDGWQFAVTDNGIGIKKEYQKKIFIIFQRLHSQNEYAGTGIGLAHCLKIVEMHGGKIWVESEPGKGSTFFFTIKD